MASLVAPQLALPQAPLDPRADWITPEEQLLRLAMPLVKERVYASRMRPSLPDQLTHRIEESAARSMIDYSKLPGLNEQSSRHIRSLFNLVTETLIEPLPLSTTVTDWYKAGSLLRSLPRKIPPAPWNIHQISASKCPIYSGQQQKDTHFLSLISEEFGTLNRFEGDILRPYGEAEYSENENPLQSRYLWGQARQEHANVAFPRTHWAWMTKDVLPGSRNKSWNEQVALVDALSQKAFVDYEIPTLQQSFTAITTHKVATEESLYQIGSEENNHVYTYTRVKETSQNYHLAVGGFDPSGLIVFRNYGGDSERIGVAALRKF